MDLGLEQRVVVVTGGSRGIGRAIALAFGRERARVALTYHSQPERGEATAAEVRALGTDAIAVPMDLADRASIAAAFAAVAERWGRLDVLINNAVRWGTRGPWDAPLFEDLDPAEWAPTFEANFEGHYTAIQRALPAMRAGGWGRIVNISSGIAVDGLPGSGAYAGAKAALHGLTRTLARELGPAGILVNVAMPGLTLTERVRERVPTALRDQLSSASPIRRLLAPEEVAPAIVFLGSAANTAVTGEIIRVSGGIT
jgi:3-oxoacyl-[acyl-carrier protein] reductase